MKNLEWINWKTEESELIDVDNIVNKIYEKYENYNSYMNPVVEENIKSEYNNGGLSKDALIINNISPANQVAKKILDDIEEVREIIEKFIEDVKNQAIEQRKIEKEVLIKKIEEKIEDDKDFIEKTKSKQNYYNNTTLEETSETLQSVIDITNNRIKMLKEKIERIKGM